MSELTLSRLRSTLVFAAPVVVLLGFIVTPYVSDETPAGFAEAALSSPDRWAWGNLIVAIGILLMVLAAFAIRTYLRDAGEDRWSPFAVPAILLGSGLVVFMLGTEALGRSGLTDGGLALETALEGSAVLGFVEVVGGILFPLGWLAMAISVALAGVMTRPQIAVMFAGLALFLFGALTVFGWSGYVFAVGAFLMLAPVGRDLWIDADITTHAPMATPRLEFRLSAHGH